MNKKLKIWLLSIVVIGVGSNLVMYLWMKIEQYEAKILYEKVQHHDKLFVYETYYGVLNPVFYVKDLKDTAELISYYSNVEKKDTSAFFNFEIKMMRTCLHEPIYVYSNPKKGSRIVQMIDILMLTAGVM